MGGPILQGNWVRLSGASSRLAAFLGEHTDWHVEVNSLGSFEQASRGVSEEGG
jgi:hypothetical protein